ncbi:DnaA regulatory inactivator Hda [Chitinasiproducens palmae]|nr:DnaA regulatory inactivator Hda [Chitinasiproducens palmae]
MAAAFRQLPLDLGAPPLPTFDNFVVGDNQEVLTQLRRVAADLERDPMQADTLQARASRADGACYLWGEPGSGRSHLLQALCFRIGAPRARLLRPESPLSSFAHDPAVALYAIDDCERLPPARQIAVFNLFNEIRAEGRAALVAAGDAPPAQLALRDDLRTRLGWGLVYRLAPLSDAGKIAALSVAARERGLSLAADVPAYLLHHFQRDMTSLMALLDRLDRFSLETQRAVTVPLLRAMLARA